MTAGVERMTVEDGPECDNCSATTWDVGVLAGAAEDDGEGIAFVDVHPAPVARCVACGWSQRLDQ